jgi:hypothetical protein
MYGCLVNVFHRFDSDFGHELAKRLDSLWVKVFAGCLFPEAAGVKELKSACSNRLHVLHLDVTREVHVRNSVKYVKNSLGNRSKYNLEVKEDKIPVRKL